MKDYEWFYPDTAAKLLFEAGMYQMQIDYS